MFTIEKNIPIPERNKSGELINISRFILSMEIGDSFFIEDVQKRVRVENSRNYLSKLGVKISVRKIESGYRCWRIK